MHFRILRSLSLVALLFASGCTAKYTTVRQNPAYNQQQVKHSDMAVLPTEAVVNTVDFGGNKERVHDYESVMEDLIGEALVSTLRKNGYRVMRLSKKDIYDKGISGQVLSLKENNNTAMDELYASYFLPEEQAFAISSNVGKPKFDFKNGKKDNLLLLSSYYADVKTSAARTRDVILDAFIGSRVADTADVCKVMVSIIDAGNGAVLWSNMYTTSKGAYAGAFERIHSTDEEIDRQRAQQIADGVLSDLIKVKEQ